VAIGLGGIATAFFYYWRGLRFPITSEGAGKPVYKLLMNKYYLDDLYEGVVVRGIREPIARGAYWINQKVIDGVVNGAGVAARGLARFVYEIIDQKGVDGIVNGAGAASEGSGSLLRHIQTGRVQQYAALMLGAVGVFALALVLL
jgi:NADH-quinone oxidoreductase subunit L